MGGFRIENLQLEDFVNVVLDVYYTELAYERLDVAIEFVENLYQRKLDLETINGNRDIVKNSKEFIEKLNGTIVMAKEKKGQHKNINFEKCN
ncbi:MAG: hypothetical protein LRY71_06340 [Bacillaceae bacterium]|nr:hypothetical protein [Bacillaceae bacterium]